jgi:hypothetical protein
MSKTKFIVFATKYLHLSSLQNYVFKNEILTQKLPSLDSPQVTINMIQNQTKFQNLNLQCPMINPYL